MALRREKKKLPSREDLLDQKVKKLLATHPSIVEGKHIAKINNLPKLTQKQIDEASKASTKEEIQRKLKEEMAKIKAQETKAAEDYLGAEAVKKIKEDRLKKNRELLKRDLALKKERQRMFERAKKRELLGSTSDEDDYSSEDEDLDLPDGMQEALKKEEKEGGYLSSFQNWLSGKSATDDAAQREAEEREKQAKINKERHDAMLKKQKEEEDKLKTAQDKARKLREEGNRAAALEAKKKANELKAQQEKERKEREKELEKIRKAQKIEEERQRVRKNIEDERKRREEERKRQAEEKEAQRIALENEQKKLQQEAEAAKAKEAKAKEEKAKEVADDGKSPEDRFIEEHEVAINSFGSYAGRTWNNPLRPSFRTPKVRLEYLKAFASDPYSGKGTEVITKAAKVFLYGEDGGIGYGWYPGLLHETKNADYPKTGNAQLDEVESYTSRQSRAIKSMGQRLGLGDKMVTGKGTTETNRDIIVRHILSQRMTDVFVKAGIKVASLAPPPLKRQVAQEPVDLEKSEPDGFTTPKNQPTKPRNEPAKRKGRQINFDLEAGSDTSSSSSSSSSGGSIQKNLFGNDGDIDQMNNLELKKMVDFYRKNGGDKKKISKRSNKLMREGIKAVIAEAGGSSSTPTRDPSPIRSATINDEDSDNETVILDDEVNEPESSSGKSELEIAFDDLTKEQKEDFNYMINFTVVMGRPDLGTKKDGGQYKESKRNAKRIVDNIEKDLGRKLFNDDFADIKAYFEKPDNPSHLLAVNKFHLRENEELDEELVMHCSRRQHEAPEGVMSDMIKYGKEKAKEVAEKMTKGIKKKRVERVDPPLLKI